MQLIGGVVALVLALMALLGGSGSSGPGESSCDPVEEGFNLRAVDKLGVGQRCLIDAAWISENIALYIPAFGHRNLRRPDTEGTYDLTLRCTFSTDTFSVELPVDGTVNQNVHRRLIRDPLLIDALRWASAFKPPWNTRRNY